MSALRMLASEAGVPSSQLFVTNSAGMIWKMADDSSGSFRDEDQKCVAWIGKPTFGGKPLAETVKELKPTFIIGAGNRDPGCFNKEVVEAMVEVNAGSRPGIF